MAMEHGASATELADSLRTQIVSGARKPGSALREVALQAEHNSGATVVRDALHLLELSGLAVQEARRGWRVRAVTPETIRQLYEVRGLLERHALERLSDADVGAVVADLTEANETLAARQAAGNVDAALRADIAFHDAILQRSPGDVLRPLLSLVNNMAAPLRRASLARDLAGAATVDEHAAIIDMLSSGMIEDAAEALHDHDVGELAAALAVSADEERPARKR
jgi:DNA-binding GntR family transcriptional regulator